MMQRRKGISSDLCPIRTVASLSRSENTIEFDPREAAKNPSDSTGLLNIRVHDSIIRNRLNKCDLFGRSARRTPAGTTSFCTRETKVENSSEWQSVLESNVKQCAQQLKRG